MFSYLTQDVLFDFGRPEGTMVEGLCE